MKEIKKAKKVYNMIKVPDKLSQDVENTIDDYLGYKTKNSIWKKVSCIAASFLLVFVVSINTIDVFAENVLKIPVIGNVAKIFTIQHYIKQDDTKLVEADYPIIANTGNTELENRINKEINDKLDTIIAEAEQKAAEYKEAYYSTLEEGQEDLFSPMEIKVDYDIKFSSDEMLSFIIYKWESYSSFQEENIYYNIDLTTGRNITLEDMLGKNYIDLANKQILSQIEERKKDENNMYFEDELKFKTIQSNQDFYINENGNVVIVFQKYEIAPGYMGKQEFEILK